MTEETVQYFHRTRDGKKIKHCYKSADHLLQQTNVTLVQTTY